MIICTDNLHQALQGFGLASDICPSPLNLFMNVPVGRDGALAFKSPVSQPGEYVAFRAECELVLVFSACPQDMIPVNNMMPVEAHFLIL